MNSDECGFHMHVQIYKTNQNSWPYMHLLLGFLTPRLCSHMAYIFTRIGNGNLCARDVTLYEFIVWMQKITLSEQIQIQIWEVGRVFVSDFTIRMAFVFHWHDIYYCVCEVKVKDILKYKRNVLPKSSQVKKLPLSFWPYAGDTVHCEAKQCSSSTMVLHRVTRCPCDTLQDYTRLQSYACRRIKTGR